MQFPDDAKFAAISRRNRAASRMKRRMLALSLRFVLQRERPQERLHDARGSK